MQPPLRSLLSRIVDYAGLFPPATLAMRQALQNYAAYRAGPHAWTLGRFVCPAARLAELRELHARISPATDQPVKINVVATTGQTAAHFRENLARDAAAVAELERQSGGALLPVALEAKLPADLLDMLDAAAVSNHAATARQALRASDLESLECFYEPTLGENWKRSIQTVVRGLAQFNAEGGSPPQSGLKLRCGGSEASAVPSCKQVAQTIAACRDHALPLKFTAGLHHPFRAYDTGLLAQAHGFINVFAAGVLASALQLELPDITGILEDTDPRSFVFSEQFMTWVEAEATVSEIEWARARRVISFGSCSFEEPVEDLKRLGLID